MIFLYKRIIKSHDGEGVHWKFQTCLYAPPLLVSSCVFPERWANILVCFLILPFYLIGSKGSTWSGMFAAKVGDGFEVVFKALEAVVTAFFEDGFGFWVGLKSFVEVQHFVASLQH